MLNAFVGNHECDASILQLIGHAHRLPLHIGPETRPMTDVGLNGNDRRRYTVGMTAPVDIGAGLRATATTDPASVPALVAATVEGLGATDIVVYVVDAEQVLLIPLPDELTHVDLPQPEGAATTMAGRAFTTQAPVTVDRAEGTRIWVPVVAGCGYGTAMAKQFMIERKAAPSLCRSMKISPSVPSLYSPVRR